MPSPGHTERGWRWRVQLSGLQDHCVGAQKESSPMMLDLCNNSEICLGHLCWAISAVGKETLRLWFLLPRFCPQSLKFACLHRTISTLYWGSAKLHSPVAAYLQADGFGPLVLCIFCSVRSLLNYLTPRRRFDMSVGRMSVVGDTDKYWCTVALRRSALFRVSYRCSWWRKERRPAKGSERRGFRPLHSITSSTNKIGLKCTNPSNHSCKRASKVLGIYYCARVSRVWNIKFDRQMSFYKSSCKSLQCRLTWNDLDIVGFSI